MKKAVAVLLVLSLVGNITLGIMLGRSYYELKEKEQVNANETLFAMQSFLRMNDILQKMVNNRSVERYELSSIQHNIIYIQAAFDKAQHLFINEINTENYHILFSYLAALEDIIYKVENIAPLDDEILAALMGEKSVAGGQYEYGLSEYIQLMATKVEKSIAQLNIQEQLATDGDGVVTIYPDILEIKKAFLEMFE